MPVVDDLQFLNIAKPSEAKSSEHRHRVRSNATLVRSKEQRRGQRQPWKLPEKRTGHADFQALSVPRGPQGLPQVFPIEMRAYMYELLSYSE